MGFFSSSTTDIDEHDVDNLLKDLSSLSTAQRAYIKGLFVQYRSGGITEQEIEKAMKELRVNTKDGIDRQAADKIRELLHTHLIQKDERKN